MSFEERRLISSCILESQTIEEHVQGHKVMLNHAGKEFIKAFFTNIVILEGGMQSGKNSFMFAIETEKGEIVIAELC